MYNARSSVELCPPTHVHTDKETEAETYRRQSHGLICSKQGHTQFLTQRPGPEHVLHELQHLPGGCLGAAISPASQAWRTQAYAGVSQADNLC